MNKYINKYINFFGVKVIVSVFILGIIIFYNFAENEFLMPESKRTNNISNVKEEILEVSSYLFQLFSKNIELNAQAQQLLYDKIRKCIINDKNSIFKKYTKNELKKFLAQLKKMEVDSRQANAVLLSIIQNIS